MSNLKRKLVATIDLTDDGAPPTKFAKVETEVVANAFENYLERVFRGEAELEEDEIEEVEEEKFTCEGCDEDVTCLHEWEGSFFHSICGRCLDEEWNEYTVDDHSDFNIAAHEERVKCGCYPEEDDIEE